MPTFGLFIGDSDQRKIGGLKCANREKNVRVKEEEKNGKE